MDPRWPSAADWLSTGTDSGAPDVALIGVPTFATSISSTGAHATPAAVRRALGRLSTWSALRRIDLTQLTALDLGDVADPDLPDGDWRVRTVAQTAAAKARLVAVVGGDNSATLHAMTGVCSDSLATTAGLITLDAHHDIREGRSNGSPVRNLIDAGLNPQRIAQVGIADWANSKSYADEAAALGITVLTRRYVADVGIDEAVSQALMVAGAHGGPIYVDLDLDVCDRAVVPGCPASLPGGLLAGELLRAAYTLGLDNRVHGIDVTEVDATNDPDDRTVRLAAMCLLEAFAGLAMRGSS